MQITPITEEQARDVLGWRYPPPYDFYDLANADPEPMLRGMLAQSGQDESALAPVASLSLTALAGMSQGRMTDEVVAELVRQANGGVIPPEPEAAPAAAGAGPWAERITPGRFEGRTVIVTGAGAGIGRATASRIAREGGRVVAVDVSAERLAALAAELPGVVTVTADITDDAGVAAVVAAAGERIDGLANVAGIMDDMTPIHEVPDAVWDRVMGVNVTGLMKLTRAVVPAMLAAGAGSVVNVGSEAGLRGSAAGVAYTASKHAVVGITKSCSYMYAGHGIRFNLVAPGPVATNIQASFASPLGQERIGAAMALLPPIAQPEQLAASIAFLLSDDGTNVTGAILPSDGGWSAI